MSSFRPTRICPHRLCRPLHLISGTGGLLVISAVASVSPWILGTCAVGVLFSIGVYQLIHRQSMVDTVREEVEETVIVTQRPHWARAAAAVDALWAVFILTMLAGLLNGRSSGGWEEPPTAASLLVSVAIGVVLMLLTEVLHRRAARVEVRGEKTAA